MVWNGKFEDISNDKIIGNEKVLIYIGLFAIIILLPLTVASYVREHYILAAFRLFLLSIVVFNVVSFMKYRRFPVKIFHVIIISGITIFLTNYYMGAGRISFVFPLIVFSYFSMDRRVANKFTLVFSFFMCLHAIWTQNYFLTIGLTLSIAFLVFYLNCLVLHIVELKQKLIDAGNRDPLTQSYNRRYLDQVVEELEHRDDPLRPTASLLMIDADHFKSINDQFGHDIGDRVLKQIADTIRHYSRADDFLFRYGGEEFVLLAKDLSSQDAMLLAERIRFHIGELTLPDGSNISVSIGIASYNQNEIIQDALKRADTQLYAAKSAGRNHVCMDAMFANPQPA